MKQDNKTIGEILKTYGFDKITNHNVNMINNDDIHLIIKIYDENNHDTIYRDLMSNIMLCKMFEKSQDSKYFEALNKNKQLLEDINKNMDKKLNIEEKENITQNENIEKENTSDKVQSSNKSISEILAGYGFDELNEKTVKEINNDDLHLIIKIYNDKDYAEIYKTMMNNIMLCKMEEASKNNVYHEAKNANDKLFLDINSCLDKKANIKSKGEVFLNENESNEVEQDNIDKNEESLINKDAIENKEENTDDNLNVIVERKEESFLNGSDEKELSLKEQGDKAKSEGQNNLFSVAFTPSAFDDILLEAQDILMIEKDLIGSVTEEEMKNYQLDVPLDKEKIHTYQIVSILTALYTECENAKNNKDNPSVYNDIIKKIQSFIEAYHKLNDNKELTNKK